MSFFATSNTDLRLTGAYKSDDTSDEANRRREMRRKQQSTSVKIQTHQRTVAKNLLDEVLGKEFTQSKNKTNGNQPDLGQRQGLPVPARLTGKDVEGDADEHRNISDGDDQLRSDQARNTAIKNELSAAKYREYFNKFSQTADSADAEALHQTSSELIEADAGAKQQAPLQNKNLPQSPLSMLTTQLDKLKNQILLIDETRFQSQISIQDLEQSAQQQARMATSLDFLEGYAEGLIKDEASRKQFEQSCTDLREQLNHSELNFNSALANTYINQSNLSSVQIRAETINENNQHQAIAIKLEHDEHIKKMEKDADIDHHDDEVTISRLDDTNLTQRNRLAKRDRNNAETTLPLLVQRSV